jgi:alpha-glucosidase
VLWETTAERPFLEAGIGEAQFQEHGNPLGSFKVTDVVRVLKTFRRIESAQPIDASTVVLHGYLSDSQSNVIFRLQFQAVAENQLQFKINIEGDEGPSFNRLVLRHSSSAVERFYGFGHQLTYFDQKGNLLPILVQEHGIGRGLPVFTQLVNLIYDGAGGTPYLTEAPAPHFITSRLRSLFLENKEYCVFDLRPANYVEIQLFSGVMTGRILFGAHPLDLIEEYSTYCGRMRRLPSWVHGGVMVAAQNDATDPQETGTQFVEKLVNELLEAQVPICGVWLQDWSGTAPTGAGKQVLWNWKLNAENYPGWGDFVSRLAQANIRVLIYINPFLVPNPEDPHDLYAEAERKGYLVQQNGRTFVYKNSTIRAGMLDLSNPAAHQWTKELIQREMIENAQASGWMADFGEALPFDAELFGGADPHVWHNHYPEAWARLHREAIEETGQGEEFVFWNRSGFTQSPGVSTLFWLGDQLQTWDEFDGIKTAVVGLLSGGMSGFSLLHSDTGGFVAASQTIGGREIPIIARSKELLMRWMELNAFTTVFRTHEGLKPSISAQVTTDDETKAHLARFGQIYKALAPYRMALVDDAARLGHPVVRHLFLHYPHDVGVYDLRYQFMLGSEFLIAPVLDKGAVRVRCYLPEGDWVHLWTGRVFSSHGGAWIEVSAPLGQPGVFFKSGSAAGEQLVVALRMAGIL